MNKFKPIIVSFNEKAYNDAEAVAKKKLELLDKASVWIHNQLDDTIKLKFNKICTDMVAYFEDLILEFYKDKNQLGLSPKKLIEAKEIYIAELHKIKFEYVKSDYKLSIPKKGILYNKNQIYEKLLKVISEPIFCRYCPSSWETRINISVNIKAIPSCRCSICMIHIICNFFNMKYIK